MDPERAMARALVLARRASGRTFPNPAVGAVVFRGERILGEGFTRPPGGPHAEVVALRAAACRHGAAAVRGACLAVTLEPCSHQGRTGPCTERILAAGIRRVFAGCVDPSPQVGGRGARRLRASGVPVEVGVLGAACREQHRGFLKVHRHGRPYVALKLAATLDGRIATARGESRWITGPAARALVHELRDRFDAVVVGSATARSDDPRLTVRRPGRAERAPVRLLLDAGLRVPPRARLFRDSFAARTWLLTRSGHGPAARRARTRGGARWLEVPRRGPHLDLARALERLAAEGLTTLLVEGGGGLAAALLRRGLVDELHWFCAPSLLGGDGRPALGALGVASLARRPRLSVREVRRVGQDLYVHARLAPSAREPGGGRA